LHATAVLVVQLLATVGDGQQGALGDLCRTLFAVDVSLGREPSSMAWMSSRFGFLLNRGSLRA
jgi:hypothetical protein